MTQMRTPHIPTTKKEGWVAIVGVRRAELEVMELEQSWITRSTYQGESLAPSSF